MRRHGEVVAIDQITIGVRRREDLGDLTGLIESLQRCGLIHPVVVDDTLMLVAGYRRLEASKRLGATQIEVRRMGDLTEEERRELELEENLHRKDLEPHERSKTLVDLARAVGARLRREAEADGDRMPETPEPAPVADRADFSANSTEKSAEAAPVTGSVEKPIRGRPQVPDSQEKISEAIGVPQRTLSDAERHVAAVGKYWELGWPGISQQEALELAETWAALNVSKRFYARKRWRKERGIVKAAPPPPKVKRRRRALPRYEVPVTRRWYILMAGLQQVTTDFLNDGGLEPLLKVWTAEERTRAVGELQEQMARLQRLYAQLTSPHGSRPEEPETPKLRLMKRSS